MRTVASYLGHSNVAMTLNTYAEVDPDAKLAAVDKIGEGFDMDLDIALPRKLEEPASRSRLPSSSSRACSPRPGGAKTEA